MFKPSSPRKSGQVLFQDRFRQVQLSVAFRRLSCGRCSFEAIYKYQVQQVRRNEEISMGEGDEVRSDHHEMWQTIPRFAEIPETIKCKRCKEVLSVDVLLVY